MRVQTLWGLGLGAGLDWIGLDYGMPNPERGQSPFARRLMGAVGDGRPPALERYHKYLFDQPSCWKPVCRSGQAAIFPLLMPPQPRGRRVRRLQYPSSSSLARERRRGLRLVTSHLLSSPHGLSWLETAFARGATPCLSRPLGAAAQRLRRPRPLTTGAAGATGTPDSSGHGTRGPRFVIKKFRP